MRAFSGGSAVKNLPEMQKMQETSLVAYLAQEDTSRRAWQPIPEFLSGESNGQRRLAGHSENQIQALVWTESGLRKYHSQASVSTRLWPYCVVESGLSVDLRQS